MATNDNFQPETMDYTINNNNNEWIASNSDTFKTPIEEPQGTKKTKKKIKLAIINCIKCTDLIKEKHLYSIGENYYHKCCVRCDNCKVQMDAAGFIIENTLFCNLCYNKSIHVTLCFGCKLPMKTHEVAMYALNQPYHLSCFKCNYCKNLLSKGDKYMFQNGFLICKQDYESGTYLNSQMTNSFKQNSLKVDNPSENNGIRRKTKISGSQRKYLEDYYLKNSIPSIKQRAYISEELNLPVKVIQTWFCNYRTKMKIQRNNELKILNEKLENNDDRDHCLVSKVKRVLEQQCFTPDQDCPTNCQISQSTEDHASPQDLSSDLSGMYNCPDIGKQSYSHRTSRGGGISNQEDDEEEDDAIDESIDDRGLTYADLSNSCVKSIDHSIMAGFTSTSSSNADDVMEMMIIKSKNGGNFRSQSFSSAAANFKDTSLDMSDNAHSKASCLTWS